jgi:branched-chain amino acid transport system ATP-binding protein
MERLLQVDDLSFYYGPIHAVKRISFHVNRGEIVTIIGANGAGKTTTLRAIAGLLGKIQSGTIVFDGTEITKAPPHKIVGCGMVQVLEGRLVFPQLTVMENLDMGAYLCKSAEDKRKRLEYCFELFPRICERQKQKAGTLSGGEQQMVAVARALMAAPKMLMMDEPSMGLAPLVVKSIFETIKKINDDGVTVLLVEQNANAALKIADRAYVLELGRITMEGASSDLANDASVRKTYLGLD